MTGNRGKGKHLSLPGRGPGYSDTMTEAQILLLSAAAVAITRIGLDKLQLPAVSRWEHAVAGASVAAYGVAITLIGLGLTAIAYPISCSCIQ